MKKESVKYKKNYDQLSHVVQGLMNNSECKPYVNTDNIFTCLCVNTLPDNEEDLNDMLSELDVTLDLLKSALVEDYEAKNK